MKSMKKEIMNITSTNMQLSEKSNTHLEEYIELLKENKNLVLTGAPGTGKTYMAHEIAREMGAKDDNVGFVQFHPSYDYSDFVEGLRPNEDVEDGHIGFVRRNGAFKDFCARAEQNLRDSQKDFSVLKKEDEISLKIRTFLENSIGKKFSTISKYQDYEIEFDETYIYFIIQNKSLTYNRLREKISFIKDILIKDNLPDGPSDVRESTTQQKDCYIYPILKEILSIEIEQNSKTESHVERKDFVFIIDEINRGEVSKIFGELFYAIDPGYRGNREKCVQTQYQNLVPSDDVFAKGFFVPENVYIIATMNDIDRSVESIDFAFRRRFLWKEVTPEEKAYMLNCLGNAELIAEATKRMNNLNAKVAAVDGLGPAFMIGPAYFLKLQSNGGDFSKLWNLSLQPLLKEYLRGFRNADETLNELHAAYLGRNLSDENDDED